MPIRRLIKDQENNRLCRAAAILHGVPSAVHLHPGLLLILFLSGLLVVTGIRAQESATNQSADTESTSGDKESSTGKETAESPAPFDASIKVPVGMAVDFPIDI